MQNTLKKVGLMSSILLSTFVSSVAYSATLNITTKYDNTGGGAGNLNQTTDQINGNFVCANPNTYANATPGCDMSADPAYTDPNGTPNDPSDDIPTGDLIVRTNDVFTVSAGFSWQGNPNVGEDNITLTGTLPAGTGFIWDSLPGFCALPGSSISADGKTIECIRKDFDTNGTGTYPENPPFPVRVEGDAANGSTPGDITFTISDTVGSATSTDGVASVNGGPVNDAHRIKITAAPRWNIDKSANLHTIQSGRVDDNGNPGWWLWYNYTIEVDEVAGVTDTGLNPRLGNEALQGGTNATVTFRDDLSGVSPNAKIVTWDNNGNFSPTSNACDMDTYSNGVYPYPSLNAANPERSIQSPVGTMAVTCTQTGSNVAVEITGIDSSLTNAPTQNRNGGALPVNRAIAAVGVIRIFVPLSDVENGADGISGNADDGTLVTENCMTDFSPVGQSGTSNFGGNGLSESENDNCRSVTLNANSGSWGKNYRKGWSDQADQVTQWGGGAWSLPPTDASIVNGGDGTVTPDSVWGTYNSYTNNGGTPITNPMLCDVIDAETFEMTILDPATDNPATFVDDRIHAVDLNYSSTENVAGIKVQYATGYVGTWPPSATTSPNPEVVTECSIPENQWFDDIPAALAAGGAGSVVTKARLVADTLLPGQVMAMRIKHTARSTFLTSGAPIPNDTLLVNYATYKSSLTGDEFRENNYIANDATQGHVNTTSGDRLILVRAKARILKDMTPSGVQPGTDVTVTLSPSFTRDGLQANAETANVTIKDLLPIGMSYTNGTTTGGYGAGPTPYGEPTVITNATAAQCATHVQDLLDQGHPCGNGESILIWDLGNQTSGTVYEDIVFHTIIDIDAPAGVRENYVLIESPADSSPRDIRIANANVINTVPTSLLIVKEVITPLNEVNKGLLNWMEFKVGLRNGSNAAATGLDVIDILPFNGDGTAGSFTFTPAVGTTLSRDRLPNPTNYNGTFEFDDVSMDLNGECTGTPTYWFTNVDPTQTTLDISPLAPTNAIPNGSANWCGGNTSVADSLASCGFAKSAVTAVRVRDVGMNALGTCFVNLTYATDNNLDNDIYSNTASARVIEVNDAALSNTVSARVFAGSIGNEVWHDMNNDGVFDAGEALAGVTVQLTPPAGVDLGAGNGVAITTLTDANGLYLFDELPAGDYTVEVIETSLPVFLRGNNTVDPDVGNNSMSAVTLGADEDNLLQDFAYYQPLGSIGDKVWNDKNNNSNFDAGEGLAGITVTLTPPAGIDVGAGPSQPITTTTNGTGDYLFPNLPAGVGYTIAVDQATLPLALQGKNTVDPDGGNNSTSQVTLALGSMDNLDQDFAYYTPASIGDTVWHDVNNNGVADAGEGIPDITVTLTLPGGGTITTTTDADGKYLFEDLPAGDYTVEIDVNDPDFPAVLNNGTGTLTEEPAGGNGDSTSQVTLTGDGTSNLEQDFAYVALGSIGDTVWQDANYDGLLDGGDTLLDGVTVTLTPPAGIDLGNGDGVAITQVTAGGGQYLFDNLPPGDYVVTVDASTGALPGLTNSVDPDGGVDSTSNVTLAEGQNNLDQDFAYVAFGSITGQVLEDTNDDGTGDDPIEGVLMRLLDVNGNPVIDIITGQPITALTDATGNYTFMNLVPSALYSTPGDYQIEQVQPGGFGSVSDVEGDDLDNKIFSVTVTAGAPMTGMDFVEKRLPPTAVPTLSEWALILLMMMLGLVGVRQANARGGVRF